MMARMIPESIKMKLKKRLEESCAGSDDKKEVIKRIRERLRARLNEAKSDSFDKRFIERIREKLRARLNEARGNSSNRKLIERIRERLRARMSEASDSSDYDRGFIKRIRRRLEERMRKRSSISEELKEKLRERLRRRLRGISERKEGSIIERIQRRIRANRLSEGMAERSYDRGYIERIRRRLEERMNKRISISEELRKRLRDRLAKLRKRGDDDNIRRIGREGISEDLRRKLRERLAKLRESRDSDIIEKIRERVRLRRALSEGSSSIGNSRIMSLHDVDFGRDKIDMMLKSVKSSRMGECVSGRDLEFYRRALRRLKEESERRKAMLKEAYKVIKRVEELGGIDKIEESLRLAHDTIVKAGSKMFKEAVDKLSAETGVKKDEAAKILRKLGLKEAKEVLKKGIKKVNEKKTEVVPVSGLAKDEDNSPIIAKRLAERLASGSGASSLVSLKEMTEAAFGQKLG